MKNNTNAIILSVLLLVALVGAVMLVQQRQETRRGAAFANTTLMLLPSSKLTGHVNDTLTAHLNFTTDGGAMLYNIDTVVCYGPQLQLLDTESTGNATLGYGGLMFAASPDAGANKCTKVVVLKNVTDISKAATTGEAAVLKFKALSVGYGSIDINKDLSKATGENQSSSDKWITVTSTTGTSYEITNAGAAENTPTTTAINTSTPVPTTVSSDGDKLLKFKMSFLGIRQEAACADGSHMPLTVTVRANDGTVKSYSNVIPTKIGGGATGLATYMVNLRLTGFNYSNNFAVFVKGPKSLQVKYGVDSQEKFYDKAGGELAGLTNSDATTQSYDFSKFPLLAGDVTGQDGNQDGTVDGQDFSYVKGESIKRTSIGNGEYMKADLNGNCQMESQDLTTLMLSLREKQGQLY